jgi:phenylacetate-CoA ligase
MTLLAQIRAISIAPRLSAYAASYEGAAPAFIASRQLRSLNTAWALSLAHSPWARAIKEEFALPAQFSSLDDFDAAVPIVGKRELRAILDAVPAARGGLAWRCTGGSTGEPFRFPTWADEHAAAALDIWLGRRRLGIAPNERLFLLWGHAHLLGSGWRGALNAFSRRLSDRLLGYVRCSAYDLAEADLDRACETLLRAKPRYVVGYSTALDRLARASMARRREIAGLKVKAVIATAEAFPHAESREVIARCFGAPVFSEYGTVETGPLAYEDQSGIHQVFWAHYRLTRRGGAGPDVNEAVVTTLYPRALPLLRYALGDLIDAEPPAPSGAGLRRIRRVVGRCNDVVHLPNGAAIHSEAFTHCMRDAPGVRAFQVVVAKQGWPRLRYEAADELDASVIREVRRRLAIVDPALAHTPLERTECVARSVAGKHKTVVVE